MGRVLNGLLGGQGRMQVGNGEIVEFAVARTAGETTPASGPPPPGLAVRREPRGLLFLPLQLQLFIAQPRVQHGPLARLDAPHAAIRG